MMRSTGLEYVVSVFGITIIILKRSWGMKAVYFGIQIGRVERTLRAPVVQTRVQGQSVSQPVRDRKSPRALELGQDYDDLPVERGYRVHGAKLTPG